MDNLKEKVSVEIENIIQVLEELKKVKDTSHKTTVELAGIATFLHNFYLGVENILKQILIFKQIQIPSSKRWHTDLLTIAKDKGIIKEHTKLQLAKYLAFRHFFTHAYSFFIDESKLKILIDSVFEVYSLFKKEIDAAISKEIENKK